MSRLTLLLCQLLVAVVFLGLWQLLTTVPIFGRMLLPPFFFSNPVDVGSQIVAWFASGVIWKHLWITLLESTLAFTIGSLPASWSGSGSRANPGSRRSSIPM
ncbi:MAG: sulfonate transport system permease protein [Bradyrhizobium sp.]|jgi:NitT/TauT family transport system permease protein|nr:sulfonate transport system permease protein [Bradyrhizobium sp.]